MNASDRYRLLDPLGEGGFATVYRAWDLQRGEDVAFKLLRPYLSSNPEMRARFRAEAQALVTLSHPNIVTLLDVGDLEGVPFFSMALVHGATLTQVLASDGPLPPERVVEIAAAVASALDYLHAAGIIHRDIKASNVMVARDGRIILMDLGIARTLDATSHTQTGAMLGTVESMSPEQVRGEQVSPSSDIYALGILVHQLAAGRTPFHGDPAYVLNAQVNLEPPSLDTLRPDLPDGFARAVSRALAKSADARQPTATAFVRELERALSGVAHTEPGPLPVGAAAESAAVASPSAASQPEPLAPGAPSSRRTLRLALATGGVLALVLSGVWLIATALPSGGSEAARERAAATTTDAVVRAGTVSATAPAITTGVAPRGPTPGGGSGQRASPPSTQTSTPATVGPSPTAPPLPRLMQPGQRIAIPNATVLDYNPLTADGIRSNCRGAAVGTAEVRFRHTLIALEATPTDDLRVYFKVELPRTPNLECALSYGPDVNNSTERVVLIVEGRDGALRLIDLGGGSGAATIQQVNIYGTEADGSWLFRSVDFTAAQLYLVSTRQGVPVDCVQGGRMYWCARLFPPSGEPTRTLLPSGQPTQ